MAIRQLSLPGDIVKKSNAIARARWQPESIWEPRIVALVASKVRETDEDFQTYRIPVAELTGHSDDNLSGHQYQEIRKSILHMAKATIIIQGAKPRNFMTYPIFSACGYEDGYLIARFDPDLKPHFLNLKAQFTAYNLFEYLNLPSSYSQQLFEILKSWANCPEIVISLVEMHETLSTPESFRKDFRQFRTRVIEKAHQDIHAHTSLRFEWEPIKQGRAVAAIRFMFGAGRQVKAETEQKKISAERLHKAKNKTALAAYDCAKRKKGACANQDNKKQICAMCKTLQYCDDLKKH